MSIYEAWHLIEIFLSTFIAKSYKNPKTLLGIQNIVQVYYTFSEMDIYSFFKKIYFKVFY